MAGGEEMIDCLGCWLSLQTVMTERRGERGGCAWVTLDAVEEGERCFREEAGCCREGRGADADAEDVTAPAAVTTSTQRDAEQRMLATEERGRSGGREGGGERERRCR